MDGSLLKFGLTAFTTLFVVVDPLGLVPIFVGLVSGRSPEERRAIIGRAIGVSFGISMFFLIAGHAALAYLGVTVHAFAISGGILLFAIAMPMLFGQRPAMQSPERRESPPENEDISIFPLAIPLLAGPGTITTILLLTAQARGDAGKIATVACAVAVVFLVARFVLEIANDRLLKRFGAGGMHIATRVLGILLAALAVQFVLNGITEYARVLEAAAIR